MFFFSDAKLKDLRKHFRKFLEVKRESGAKLVFRYYDPRVLRVYLPTCTPEERALVFGPVAEFLVEGHDPATLLRFAPEGEADGGGGSGKLVIRDAQWQAFAREELRKLALKSHAPGSRSWGSTRSWPASTRRWSGPRVTGSPSWTTPPAWSTWT